MFEWLLTVSPAQLLQGRLLLEGGWWTWAILTLGLALVVYALMTRQGLIERLTRRRRRLLWSLRSALFALLTFILLEPVLIAESEEPVRGEVALLLDDTLSMRIDDLTEGSRAAYAVERFAPGGTVAREIGQRFTTRHWRFAHDLQPLQPGETPTFSGSRSRLAAALAQLARDGAPGSVVLVSDGHLDDPAGLDQALEQLRAAGITVHTVAVGGERPRPDVEVSAVTLPDSVLQGDTVTAGVTLSQRDARGRTVTLVVEEDSTIVAERTLTLPEDGRRLTVQVPLAFTVPGPRRLDFRVEGGEDGLGDNDTLTRLIRVRDEPLQVLHLEGEPRFEVKFLRRAVADDEAIRLASLVRTAENKYFRLGIDGPDELAQGLPASDEELFRFDVVVLGSADADLLDEAQQRRLRDFVARRGGGLIVLGGSGALAEGGFQDTPLADLLPVVLDPPREDYRSQVRVRPTAAGLTDPLLKAALPLEAAAIEALPALTVINPLRRAKPGARVLLEADDGSGGTLIVLAHQRYGRGSVAVFGVRNTWRWQMSAELPPEDPTHETLWRALLRGLGGPAPERIEVTLSPADAALGETVTVTAEVLDGAYRPLADAAPVLAVTTPLGDLETLPLEAVPGVPGRYTARLNAARTGRYDLEVRGGGDDPQRAAAYLRVDSAGDEFRHPTPDPTLLARIARATGGQTFRHDQVGDLPRVLESTRTTRTVIRRFELWDAPLLLLALLTLVGIEWFYRRHCALA